MNSAQNDIKTSQSSTKTSQSSVSDAVKVKREENKKKIQENQIGVPVSVGKEAVHPVQSKEAVSDLSAELEIPHEVEKAGVKKIGEEIELPPDMKKIGKDVKPPAQPIQAEPLPKITLPISDEQVLEGEKAGVFDAIKWLAVWCVRKLQKAHIALKKVHGKVVRVFVKD